MAEEKHCSVSSLLRDMPQWELCYWLAHYRLKDEKNRREHPEWYKDEETKVDTNKMTPFEEAKFIGYMESLAKRNDLPETGFTGGWNPPED